MTIEEANKIRRLANEIMGIENHLKELDGYYFGDIGGWDKSLVHIFRYEAGKLLNRKLRNLKRELKSYNHP
jgi:hypothetical protein